MNRNRTYVLVEVVVARDSHFTDVARESLAVRTRHLVASVGLNEFCKKKRALAPHPTLQVGERVVGKEVE
jgi:hypothetical protein